MNTNIAGYTPVNQSLASDQMSKQETSLSDRQEIKANMSGWVITKEHSPIGLCKFITNLFFGVVAIGTVGGGTGAFLLYESDKRLKKFPGDKEALEESTMGTFLLLLTFVTILSLTIIGGETIRRKMAQKAAYQKIVLE